MLLLKFKYNKAFKIIKHDCLISYILRQRKSEPCVDTNIILTLRISPFILDEILYDQNKSKKSNNDWKYQNTDIFFKLDMFIIQIKPNMLHVSFNFMNKLLSTNHIKFFFTLNT